MAEDRNTQSLKVTLGKLGITPHHFDPQASAADLKSSMATADVAFIDTDMLDAQFAPIIAGLVLPVVAVIGIESPSRLQRAFDIEPSAVLMLGIALLWKDGERHGWGSWEKTLLALVWVAPLFARGLADATLFPLGLCTSLAILAIAVRRGVTASPSRHSHEASAR